MKKCPLCAEEIQDAAVKCKHCGSMLTQVPPIDSAGGRPPPSVDLDEELKRLIDASRKIDAIKLLRDRKPIGLAEAKAYVDALEKGVHPEQFPTVPKRANAAGVGCLLVILFTIGVYFAFSGAIWEYLIPPPGGASSSSGAPAAVTQAVEAALLAAGSPAAQSIVITSGHLIATFEIDNAAWTLIAAGGISSPREFASKTVITIRNAELPFNLVDSYRVTMNGPPPGPGLITRYGSARFSEGSSVDWEPGLPR